MNIYDVAKLSGVSIATASKALNGRKDVREETRQRVLDIAKKLNYHPSHMARGLAKRCSENIGVIALRRVDAPFFTDPFYSRVMEGMEAAVTRENYNLLMTVLPGGDGPEAAAEQAFPKMVREKNVDGLCLLGEIPADFLSEISSRNIPAVVVGSASPYPGHYVLPDHASGLRQGIQHLLQLGHRKLAFVSQRGAQDSNFSERRACFEQELGRAGLKALPGLDLDLSTPGLDEAAAAYLKKAGGPTALVCCNDEYALKVLGYAAKLGVRVPEDLSVLGFDDVEWALNASPALSTLHVNKQDLGARAIQIIFDLIAHPEAKPKRVELPVHLVVRASTGKAAR